jgi:DNA-binding transcriptional ArsR family regulator
MFEALNSAVRRRVLLELSAAGGGEGAQAGPGRLSVAALAQRVGIPQKRLSRHLGILKMRGILHSRQSGQTVWYECVPGTVRRDPHPDGRPRLTVTHPSGAEVTFSTAAATSAPATRPPPEAP